MSSANVIAVVDGETDQVVAGIPGVNASRDLAAGKRRVLELCPAPYHLATIHGTAKVHLSSRTTPGAWVIDQQALARPGEIAIRGEGHQMGAVTR